MVNRLWVTYMTFEEIFTQLPLQAKADESSMAILGDCISILQMIKDQSCTLIFADPPYNIGKEFEEQIISKEAYLQWIRVWIDECMRILKPEGTFYCMAATQYMPYIDSYIDSKYLVRARIVWTYDSSGVQAKRFFGSMYEPILMVVKNDKKYKFNAAEVMVEAKTGAVRKLIDYRKTPPRPYQSEKVLGNVWNIPRVRFKMDEYENHPTQKPEKLLEIMIRASTDEGDLVLDPFAGSFTTCAVAKKLQRKSVGIEINEEYFKMGLRRLNLASSWNGSSLEKVKIRKTNHKSKKDQQLSPE